MSFLYQSLVSFLIVALAAYAQVEGILKIGDVNPNLVLVAVIAFSFFAANFLHLLALILCAALLLMWQPGISYELLAFVALLSGAVFLKRFIRWQMALTSTALIGSVTLLYAIAANPEFVMRHPFILFGEFVYNMALGSVLFVIFGQFERRLI